MAEGLTKNAVPLAERLPEDLIDAEARDRLVRFLDRIGEVARIDERGRAVADRSGLESLLSDGALPSRSASEALGRRLAEADERELVDEGGRVRPLSAEEVERLTSDLTREGLDRALSELVPDRPWADLVIAVFEDGPQPANETTDTISPEEVDGKVRAFLDCVKEDFGLFALLVAGTAIGIILAIYGVAFPPIEIAAVEIILIFGAEVAAFIMHCLVKAGFFLS